MLGASMLVLYVVSVVFSEEEQTGMKPLLFTTREGPAFGTLAERTATVGGNTDRDGAQLQYGQQADKKQLCQIDADRLHHKREGKEDPLYDGITKQPAWRFAWSTTSGGVYFRTHLAQYECCSS